MIPQEPEHQPVVVPEIKNPSLVYKEGAVAADPISLRLAAREFEKTYGVKRIFLPEIVEKTQDGGNVFAELAKVKIEGRVLNVIIDTGKMTWANPEQVEQSNFIDYKRDSRQSATFKDGGLVMQINGMDVSRHIMHTPNGKEVYMWFAQTQPGQAEDVKRYTLISGVQQLAQEFNERSANSEGTLYPKISIPAAQASYKGELPEIVEVNPSVESGEQEINFAVDYTGARTVARTELVYENYTPEFTFGTTGPVVYWYTEIDEVTPFAPVVTTPEAWLKPGDSADFDFPVD